MKLTYGNRGLLLLAALSGWMVPGASVAAVQTPDSLDSAAAIRITFLDVGQADAVLIQAPEGQTALVDAGRGSPVEALRRHDVGGIGLLVASHAHADHIGGMAAVMEAFPVRFYLDNGLPHTTATYRRVMETLERKTEIAYLNPEPRTISLGSATIEVLPMIPVPGAAPPAADTAAVAEPAAVANSAGADPPAEPPVYVEADDQNNRSVALIVRHGSFSAFLSGDSETEQLDFLVGRDASTDLTLLKAPHHGSRNGVTLRFMEAARPEVVVISVGANNTYGHPMPEALGRFHIYSEVYRTDRDGAVTVLGYPDGRYEVVTAKASDGGTR